MLCDLAIKSRHFKITTICSVQYCKEIISSSIRSNVDYIFFSDMNENFGLKTSSSTFFIHK